ncbi:hypothetical protein TPY_1378 [Sulfobacillus acidophilus TPY]|nr:hypothetical protein TPY_1378 [Sulfobacillus acidophilus TPY]
MLFRKRYVRRRPRLPELRRLRETTTHANSSWDLAWSGCITIGFPGAAIKAYKDRET